MGCFQSGWGSISTELANDVKVGALRYQSQL